MYLTVCVCSCVGRQAQACHETLKLVLSIILSAMCNKEKYYSRLATSPYVMLWIADIHSEHDLRCPTATFGQHPDCPPWSPVLQMVAPPPLFHTGFTLAER